MLLVVIHCNYLLARYTKRSGYCELIDFSLCMYQFVQTKNYKLLMRNCYDWYEYVSG